MRIHPFVCFMLLVLLLFSAGCEFLRLPGLVTIPAPGMTGMPAPTSSQIVAAPPVLDVLTPAATLLLTPAVQPSANPTALPPSALAPLSRLLPQYVINVSMDYAAKTLDVQQEIDFPNTTGVDIPDFLLAVQPNRISGVFSLLVLQLDDKVVTDYTLKGQRLQWKLVSPLKPGHSAHIHLEYHLALPVIEQGDPNLIRPQIFGVTARQVNLTDWYPMLVPFEPGIGWRLADPWYYGEHLVYPLANFDVTLRFIDPANPPVVAASAPAQPVEGGSRYVLERGRDFALAMGRQLQVVSAELHGVTISSYYYPGSETGARAVLDATVKSLKTFSALFGPYPHNTLAAVQADFNDGMEFDGLFYLSNSFYNLYDGTQNNYLIMIAAHETSHQWWFGKVASDQANQPWLDESLATYSEKLFYEQNYPDSVKWWWSYRIDFYQPEGKIDGGVQSFGGFTPYTDATYRQGARFLDELRQVTGDETFFAFLKDYAAQMDGQIATPGDFFRILRQHTPADLSGLLAKYFANPPK